MPDRIFVNFEYLDVCMGDIKEKTKNIHIINGGENRYSQDGFCDLPSYKMLLDQLDVLNMISTRIQAILETMAANVTAAYTGLYGSDTAISEELEG